MPSYSAPSVGPAGLTIPLFPAIVGYLQAQFLSIYGATSDLSPSSPDQQDIVVRALQANDVEQALQQVYLSFNPLTATGPSLDYLGILIGTARKTATFSTALLTVSGANGTVINNGFVRDINGNNWSLPAVVNIPGGGTVNVTATCQTIGTVTANPGTITAISTPTAGWTSVTNASAAVPGQPVESDSAYRARLRTAQALPSRTIPAGTAAAVAQLPGVTRSQLYENSFGYTTSYGLVSTSGTTVTLLNGYPFDSSMASAAITIAGVGYTVSSVTNSTTLVLASSAGSQSSASFQIGDGVALGPEHSITVVVEGGLSADIAQAIYNNKGIGPFTNGSTSVVVTDPNNGGLIQTIRFTVLNYLQIYVALNVHALTGYTTATTAAITAGIVSYLNSLGIGEPVVWGEIIAAALTARSNPDIPTFAIESLTDGYLAASTTGTLNGTTSVTITGSTTGIVNGQVCVGSGIPPNTTITISGSTVTLSNAATASASGVALNFFALESSGVTIPMLYDYAAQGLAVNVTVNLV